MKTHVNAAHGETAVAFGALDNVPKPRERLSSLTAKNERRGESWEQIEPYIGGGAGVLETLCGTVQGISRSQLESERALGEIRGLLFSMNSRLEKAERIMERIASESKSILARQTRLDTQLNALEQAQAVHEHNLKQIRLVCESMARRMDELTDDFIRRQVEGPLLREHLRTYGLLCCLRSSQGIDVAQEVATIVEGMAQFLESRGLSIINPSQGDPFRPREHQAIERRETENNGLDGCVACTHQPGLAQDGRIIQPARVAVFGFGRNAEKHSTPGEEE